MHPLKLKKISFPQFQSVLLYFNFKPWLSSFYCQSHLVTLFSSFSSLLTSKHQNERQAESTIYQTSLLQRHNKHYTQYFTGRIFTLNANVYRQLKTCYTLELSVNLSNQMLIHFKRIF